MTTRQFFRRLFFHLAAASTTLIGCLFLGEWLVPGSVLPFFNAVDAVLPLIVLLCAAGLVFSTKNHSEHE